MRGTMSRIRRWNVDAAFSVEVNVAPDGEWVESQSEKSLPGWIVAAIQAAAPGEECGEIVLPFVSKGYYDPGRTYDPDTAYPPEGDDERWLTGLAWFEVARTKHHFTAAASEALFEHYLEEVYKVEIDTYAGEGN